MITSLDLSRWVNDKYVRTAYRERGLSYEQQLAALSGYSIQGYDPICKARVQTPSEAGQIWLEGGEVVPFSSAACTLRAVKEYESHGQKFSAVYVTDRALGIELFADSAFYVIDKTGLAISLVPFLLKHDAEQYSKRSGGSVATYTQALNAISAATQ